MIFVGRANAPPSLLLPGVSDSIAVDARAKTDASQAGTGAEAGAAGSNSLEEKVGKAWSGPGLTFLPTTATTDDTPSTAAGVAPGSGTEESDEVSGAGGEGVAHD